jgi:hypothetical protein
MPSRANTPLASDTPEPLSGAWSRRNVKPLVFTTADSFINEADGRDQPVDLKPQTREVPIKAEGIGAPRPTFYLHRPADPDSTALSRCPPLDVLQRVYAAGEPVADRLSNRAVDAVEPRLGLLAQPVNLALEPSASSQFARASQAA